jgi:hypothetical protein
MLLVKPLQNTAVINGLSWSRNICKVMTFFFKNWPEYFKKSLLCKY